MEMRIREKFEERPQGGQRDHPYPLGASKELDLPLGWGKGWTKSQTFFFFFGFFKTAFFCSLGGPGSQCVNLAVLTGVHNHNYTAGKPNLN